MTWLQLLEWVNNPTTPHARLKEACRGLGLPDGGNEDSLKGRLRNYIARQPDLAAGNATWSPTGVVPVTPPVTPPAPTVAVVAPVSPTPPPTGGGATAAVPTSVLVCPKCGTENRPGAKFCRTCTEPLSAVAVPAEVGTWVCTYCRHENLGDAKACENCGKARRLPVRDGDPAKPSLGQRITLRYKNDWQKLVG